jgi:hypothetical protein
MHSQNILNKWEARFCLNAHPNCLEQNKGREEKVLLECTSKWSWTKQGERWKGFAWMHTQISWTRGGMKTLDRIQLCTRATQNYVMKCKQRGIGWMGSWWWCCKIMIAKEVVECVLWWSYCYWCCCLIASFEPEMVFILMIAFFFFNYKNLCLPIIAKPFCSYFFFSFFFPSDLLVTPIEYFLKKLGRQRIFVLKNTLRALVII